MKKKILVICGPTACGKTALALDLADYYHTSILSFDSRQCYQELNIGVAKPSQQELQMIPHYFINSHQINDRVNAVTYEKYALEVLKQEFTKQETVIVVGGTGLYIDALCNGVDAIPDIPESLRSSLQNEYLAGGLPWLKEQIQRYDKNFTAENDLNNSQRMLRALEVVLHTGFSIKHFQRKEKTDRDFEVVKFGISIERPKLNERINARVDEMMLNGLLEEVQNLQEMQFLNALQTVGYKELFGFLKGDTDLDTAINLIKQHTRNYAKRQMTWFRKDKEIYWGDVKSIVNMAKKIFKD